MRGSFSRCFLPYPIVFFFVLGSAFARLYPLLYEPQKKKLTNKTASYASSAGYGGQYTLSGTAEGEGLVGPRPHHFFAPPPLLFALKRKKIKIEKKTWNKYFPVYIPLYSLYFLEFQRPGILWGSCALIFAVIVPWGRLAPWSNAMPWPPLRFVRQCVLYFQLRQRFLSVLSDEMKKITSFFKPNEGE